MSDDDGGDHVGEGNRVRISRVTSADLPRIRQRNAEREEAERKRRKFEAQEGVRLETEGMRQRSEEFAEHTGTGEPFSALRRALNLDSQQGEE